MRTTRSVLLVAVLLVLGLPSVVSLAVPQAGQDSSTLRELPSEIDVSRIAQRIAELEAMEGTDEFPQALADELAALRETQQVLQQAAQVKSQAAEWSDAARSAPTQQAQIDTYMGQPAESLVQEIDRNWTLEELNGQLEATRARLQEEQRLLARVDEDESRRATRRAAIPNERANATEQLDAVAAQLAAGPGTDESSASWDAKRMRMLARQYLYQLTLLSLDEELKNYDARRTLLEKRRAYRERRIGIENRNITSLQGAIRDRQIQLAADAEAEAQRQRIAAANSHPLVAEIVEKNAELTTSNTAILSQSERDAALRDRAAQDLRDWKTAFGRSTSRVDRVGLTNDIGQHLRSQKSRLPDTDGLERAVEDREDAIARVVNQGLDLDLMTEELAEIDVAVNDAFRSFEGELPSSPDEIEQLRNAAREALLQQREYATTLNENVNAYLDNVLFELQAKQRELLTLLESYRSYIDERILWIRSAERFGTAHFNDLPDAMRWSLDRRAWPSIWEQLRADVREHPALYIIAVPGLLALIFLRPVFTRRLQAIADETRRWTTDRLMLSVAAIIVTTVRAAGLPALLAFIGWRIDQSVSGFSLASGLSSGLSESAFFLFVLEVIAGLCRSDGLGGAHFRWKSTPLRSIRQNLRWAIPVLVLLAFITEVTAANDRHHESLGRLAFIAEMLAVTVLFQRLFKPSGPVLRGFLQSRKGGWIDRLRFVWYTLLMIAPMACAIVAAMGYLYSATQLEARVIDSVWLLALVLVGQALLHRGLFLAQRRIDIEQRRKRLAAQLEAEAEKAARDDAAEAEASGEAPGEPRTIESIQAEAQARLAAEAEEIDVAAMSAQTRQLVNSAVVVSIIIGLAVVWVDMLPALGYLQEKEVWSIESTSAQVDSGSTDVGSMLTGGASDSSSGTGEAEGGEASAEGSAEASSPESTSAESSGAGEGAITVGDLLYALIIVLMTILVSKNIPGLMEIVLLQHLPITPSGRYALTTVARYALVMIGVMLAFSAIGVGWSKVQWLVAAMTVGLGFGLQEIFANFVSGLIILFERPIRVGDTVTVGGISGTVSKLRIRATTIVDWDRKELIIPNKEFVTGQIVNWSLSDPILRLIVPVGIAYGSDTKKAEELLLKVALEEPTVLAEPKPTVVFASFGASSLDFQLRVFIPRIEDLFPVRHRLHNSIDRAFRAANITIAFPQQDVHLHYVNSPPRADESGD